MGEKYAKNARTLDMYERLREGKSIRKCEEAQRFGVDERSIQRDIDDIRAFLDERQMQGDGRQVIYDRAKKGFVMEGQEASTMSNSEILAVAKILLESRAFSGREMTDVLQKMVDGCVPRQNMKVVSELISNESFHYVELKHGGCVEEKLWQIGMDIKEHNLLKIRYQRLDASEQPVVRVVEPVAILFSEYYFYLNAYIVEHTKNGKYERNYDYPAIFRLDRILDVVEMGEKFPRDKTIYQLAKALHVSIRYLKDDECENPTEDIEKDIFIAEASEQYGMNGARDLERMLAENTALFAGGDLSQEEKDTYFNALMTAYVTCRETAKEKYGKKK